MRECIVVLVTYDISFNIDEDVDPTQCNDLFELIHSGQIVNKLDRHAYYLNGDDELRVDIVIRISKSPQENGDNIYYLTLKLMKDDSFNFRHSYFVKFGEQTIVSLYNNGIIGKYVVVFESSIIFKLNTTFPVGVKTILFDAETTTWELTEICSHLNNTGDVETFNQILGNMSSTQFEFVKPILYASIMYKAPEVKHIIIYKPEEFGDEFKAAFLHWCNKFELEKENSDISL